MEMRKDCSLEKWQYSRSDAGGRLGRSTLIGKRKAENYIREAKEGQNFQRKRGWSQWY
jgi:hypothetical protein